MSSLLAVDQTSAALIPGAAQSTGTPGGAQFAAVQWHMQCDTWEWEPAFFDIYGVSAAEVVPGAPALLSMQHPDDLAMLTALMHGVARGEEFSVTHRIFREDGFVRRINTRSQIDTDSKGQPSLLHASVGVRSDWALPLPPDDLPNASDGELMLCLRAQMPEAMVETFRRHRSHMIGLVHHLHATVDADDIVQDVFEELFRKPKGFDVRRGSLATYLNMKARSRSMDVWRSQTNRRKREDAYEHRPEERPTEEAALLGLSDRAVRAALAELPRRERVPIVLAYPGGLTYRAVGERLGIPEGTAKARIRKGLVRLRSDGRIGSSPNGSRSW